MFYYKGFFIDNKPQGYGELLGSDQTTYKGNFENGKKHDLKATLIISSEKYVGEFKNDKKSGFGTVFHNSFNKSM